MGGSRPRVHRRVCSPAALLLSGAWPEPTSAWWSVGDYTRPANRFGAEFIGLTNLLPAGVTGVAGNGPVALGVSLGGGAHDPLHAFAPGLVLETGTQVVVSIRPEDVEIGPSGERAGGDDHVDGIVTSAVYMGSRRRAERGGLGGPARGPRSATFDPAVGGTITP